ncbi:MAG: orotate phosphoribosyltransferase [Chloroflexi bacterium]|nr:orotate phosphoribosyltransferase [Chloroflexota bacterium]MDA1226507.1 orotate phosphoribosyltransferase [Chloroflexota bacterium]
MGNDSAEAILALAKKTGALMFGEFKLSAGGTSSYYFDGRMITLDPEGANLISEAFMPVLTECGAEALAGPTLGADPIVSSVALLSYQQGHPIPGLIVRKEAKAHGGKRGIEGPLVDGARVAVVDDTCSTGASLFLAIDAMEAAGCKVIKVLSILDRHQGGSEEIIRRGYDFFTILEADADGNITPANNKS